MSGGAGPPSFEMINGKYPCCPNVCIISSEPEAVSPTKRTQKDPNLGSFHPNEDLVREHVGAFLYAGGRASPFLGASLSNQGLCGTGYQHNLP